MAPAAAAAARAPEIATWATTAPRGPPPRTTGLSSSDCSGACTAGYYCAAASLSATSIACPAGWFGSGGSGNASCCGACSAGYYCPSGSATDAANACPAGKFGMSGCATDACSGLCAAGRYGSGGSTSDACSGLFAVGFYCPAGTASATAFPCPPGTYARSSGGSNCTGTPAPMRAIFDSPSYRSLCAPLLSLRIPHFPAYTLAVSWANSTLVTRGREYTVGWTTDIAPAVNVSVELRPLGCGRLLSASVHAPCLRPGAYCRSL